MEHDGLDEVDEQGYRWTSHYEKSWENIRENDDGLLQPTVEDIIHQAKRRKLEKKNVRLGMTRHLYVVVDFSECMNQLDLKPSRHLCTLKILEGFVEQFFDENPISQLGIIITRDKRAEKISELSGDSRIHSEAIAKLKTSVCKGEPSLQNSLELAMQTLKNLPTHTSREVVIIFGSLTTCDPSEIGVTLKQLQENNIRCSIIGLAAELSICKRLTSETRGTYNVILNDFHFQDILNQKLSPPLAMSNQECSLVRMGFPSFQEDAPASMCYCHDSKDNPGEGFTAAGYFCPLCQAKYCQLPIECKLCGLTLVSGANLARSYHHLFPLDNYIETPILDLDDSEPRFCFSCHLLFEDKFVYRCPHCEKVFCIDCELFIHNSLHTCPGCASAPKRDALPS